MKKKRLTLTSNFMLDFDIAMQTFIAILDEIAQIDEVVNRNEDFTAIISLLRDVTL